MIGNVEIALAVDRDSGHVVQHGCNGRTPVTAEPSVPRACHGGDDAVWSDFSNSVVARIIDIQVARGIDRNLGR
jgi:hypothetical protein